MAGAGDGEGDLEALLRAELRAWDASGLRRELDDAGGEPAPRRSDFRSNDVLGLAGDGRVIAAAHAALAEFGAGGRAARLLGGGSPLAARAEQSAAAWLDAEAALLFPSGWQANLGVIGALAGRGDALFSDELNHASLIDGCRLARATVHVFPHRDLGALSRQLAAGGGARRRIVVTESIFSMDGDLAPLPELHELCERHGAWLVVDEAHALGLLGPRGAGAWAATGRRGADARRLAARVATGGKALGVGGAFVVGSAALRDTLLQRARAFVFTTAPPPMVAGALLAAIEACRGADAVRARVVALARRIATALALPPPDAAIVPVAIGDAAATVAAGAQLARAGFAVGAVRPPTVPEGSSRLRLVAHAFNDERAADELAHAIAKLRGPTRPASPAASAPRAETWFVVGTDTGVGKTVVSALLLRAARALGRAAYWKPVQTGSERDTDVVGALAQVGAGESDALLASEHCFARPASPHEAAAAEGKTIDVERLRARLDAERRRLGDARLLVELAGGLLVPYSSGAGHGGRTGAAPFLQADWVATTRAGVIVVARSGVGTLNHTLLTLEALRARHVEPAALFLVGEPHAENAATLRALAGLAPDRLFELPRFEPLVPAALADWLARHDLAPLLGPARRAP